MSLFVAVPLVSSSGDCHVTSEKAEGPEQQTDSRRFVC